MLNLTRKTDYALVAMAHLHRIGPEHSASAREIAEAYGLPRALLMNILKQLCQGGLVQSARGAAGGYRLVADAEVITLLDVVITIEGTVKAVDCALSAEGGPGCGREHVCPITSAMRRLHTQICELLRRTTLADIVNDRDPIGLASGGNGSGCGPFSRGVAGRLDDEPLSHDAPANGELRGQPN